MIVHLCRSTSAVTVSSVRDMMAKAMQLGGSEATWHMTVEVRVTKLVGLGGPEFTYIGCSKQVSGPPGVRPWQCRKRVTVGDRLEDEVLNHQYKHAGSCSQAKNGVPCFAMVATIEDVTGFTIAQIWNPAIHMLGMFPSHFRRLSEYGMGEILSSVLNRKFKMRVMIVWRRIQGHIFKVLWVEELQPSIPRQPRRDEDWEEVPDVYDLLLGMGSLTVCWDFEGPAESQGESSAPTDNTISFEEKEALEVLDSLSASLQKVQEAQNLVRVQVDDILISVAALKERLGLV